jgi:ABC-2 type transport system ATP-binding protein
MDHMQPVLKVENLVKDFGSLRALNGVSFVIPKGTVVGLLGPNGAGKTTCIDVLLGTTIPNGGSVEYFERDFFTHKQAALKRINFASAYHNLQYRTSVRENLLVFAHLYEIDKPSRKIDELLDYFEIWDIAARRFGDLSAGQRTRVNLIKSLMNDPELILMDEPTASLDPDIADKTLSLIENLRRDRELSILFTSHNMDEVSRICDDVIFLDHGEIVAQGTPLDLTKQIPDAELQLAFDRRHGSVVEYLTARGHRFHVPKDCQVVITMHEREIAQILTDITGLGTAITEIDLRKPDLEDVFLQIARRSNVVQES